MTFQPENAGMLLESEPWESGPQAWSWNHPAQKNGKPVEPVTLEGIVLGQTTGFATDPKTGKQKVWESGNPVRQVILNLQTELHETDEDDGIRRLFMQIPSGSYTAVRDAMKDAKIKAFAIGDKLAITWHDTDRPTRPGLNGQKKFAAIIEPVERQSLEPPF